MRAASQGLRHRKAGISFQNILVCGITPYDAPMLLSQAANVVTPGSSTIRLLEPSSEVTPARASVEAMARVLDSLSRMGVPLLRETIEKPSGENLVEQITGGRHDLVFKAVTGGNGHRTLLPLDLALVRRSPCPVWFVDRAQPRVTRRILAAVDPEADDEGSRALARRVVSLGADLAATVGAELHILHAWIAFGEPLLRSRLSPSELEGYVADARERAERGARAVLGDDHWLTFPRAHTHFRKGELEETLPQLAAGGNFDLVVMGTKGRKSWLDSVIRPHAESILTRTSVSVLVTKVA